MTSLYAIFFAVIFAVLWVLPIVNLRVTGKFNNNQKVAAILSFVIVLYLGYILPDEYNNYRIIIFYSCSSIAWLIASYMPFLKTKNEPNIKVG